MAEPWLIIIGVSEGYPLTEEAKAYLKEAQRVISSHRLLDEVAPQIAEKHTWPSPLSDILPKLEEWRGSLTIVLATGDPLSFGIGNFLLRHFGSHFSTGEIRIIPGISAFALARSRLGWSFAREHTLHGRPLDSVRGWIGDGLRLLVLAHDERTPFEVARVLCEEGYSRSDLHILEHIGGEGERARSLTASELVGREIGDISPFHTLGILCVADGAAELRSPSMLLEDGLFQHDGQITKPEVRAAALARLEPYGEQTLWDLGAGCGSVAISWLRGSPQARALAVERDPSRAAMIRENARRFGVLGLEICEEEIGDFLARADDLPPPDAIFFGGGLSTPRAIERGLGLLARGGRIVAHAVTIESEFILTEAHRVYGGQLVRLSVTRAEVLGGYRGWRAMMPVTQWFLRRE
ncbi:MAG: precorrin-6y C5,15-methyltransferase (decarboxylating) subunit CbiE [Alphaproteobacteria bacterium]